MFYLLSNHTRFLNYFFVFFCAVFFLFPSITHAIIHPFGGQMSVPVPCIGGGKWTVVGPPVGGPYVWFPGTRTYLYGPPAHPGQWLLGNAGPVGFCVVSINPPIIFEGGTMIMLGSSI
jgi:hypothetical protein